MHYRASLYSSRSSWRSSALIVGVMPVAAGVSTRNP